MEFFSRDNFRQKSISIRKALVIDRLFFVRNFGPCIRFCQKLPFQSKPSNLSIISITLIFHSAFTLTSLTLESCPVHHRGGPVINSLSQAFSITSLLSLVLRAQLAVRFISFFVRFLKFVVAVCVSFSLCCSSLRLKMNVLLNFSPYQHGCWVSVSHRLSWTTFFLFFFLCFSLSRSIYTNGQ